MSYKTFLAVIVYIYTGEIDELISIDDTLLLLAAANKYILPRLKHLCESALMKVLTVENVFCILFYCSFSLLSVFLFCFCFPLFLDKLETFDLLARSCVLRLRN